MVPAAKGARITGEEREQLMLSCVRRYRAGESIRSLAADTGRSYGFIQGLLKEAGVPLRARGGATRGAEAEADRRERQARVEAVRAAEQAGEDLGDGPGVEDAPPPGSEPSGQRDLGRAPTSPADLGLPTPPLGVLVKKKSKGRSKAKRIAAEKAKEGNGPRILALLEEASTATGKDRPASVEKKAKKDKAKKRKKDKKDKASRKDGVGSDKKPKKSGA